ncbi:GPN-loop GTPase 2 isoform X1 [Apus apus]|uniref:GPN-loop GTPase 2 isoform X1 n=1 Tax=Apus apus TaxID=8895 RepID=UPI0021F8C39B|nr:GPN-loop GTPase 2 isoform X1 [Apus apus]XP_051493830.1 GPN-loop GTPase 2 isoform X1 [Apus apus]
MSESSKGSSLAFGQVVIGPPGSGKTTYCHGMQEFLGRIGRKVTVVNLDPANDSLPYQCSLDIAELITLPDVMEDLKLGPNGGLIYCMEYLEANFDWLQEKLATSRGHYYLFDCPGQVELYTHHDALKNVFAQLAKWNFRLAAVHLVDSHYCTDPGKFISVLCTSLSTMLHVELPHVNVLSKMDLIEQYGKLGESPWGETPGVGLGVAGRWLGSFSAWKREGSRETLEHLPGPEGAPGKLGRGLGQGQGGRGQGGWIKTGRGEMEVGHEEETLGCEGGESLAQVAQGSCGCPIPGSVEGQVGWGLEQPGLVGGVPAHAGGGTGWSLRSLPTQTSLEFYEEGSSLLPSEFLGVSLQLSTWIITQRSWTSPTWSTIWLQIPSSGTSAASMRSWWR